MSATRIRCKLIVTSLNPGTYHHTDGTSTRGGTVTLKAVHAATLNEKGEFHSYEQACEENKLFGRWTPSAHFSMGIANPEAYAAFVVGKEFYVDLTPADTVEDYDAIQRQKRDAAQQ